MLARLDANLVIEGPNELRGRVLTLAQRLLVACSDDADATARSTYRERASSQEQHHPDATSRRG